MKMQAYAVVGVMTLAIAGAAGAQDKTDDMPGMSSIAAAPVVKTGQGVGVIKKIDAQAGNVTIQHGPIPTIGWPAMTMTFKATPQSLLNGLTVGQRIGFDAK